MQDDMNILLVEDNDLDVEILKRGLRKIGASGALVRARDGQEALDLLCDDTSEFPVPQPFVVLLDVNMPRMNGHEFLTELRDAKPLSKIRVIVFTTSDNPKDIEQAYQKNAVGYIVKPSSSSELTGILESLREFWRICQHPQPEPA